MTHPTTLLRVGFTTRTALADKLISAEPRAGDPLQKDGSPRTQHGGKIDAMTKDANRLLEEALQLAPNERAKIAAELLSSLDEQDQDVKSAWASEIARRAADADADPEDEEDWRVALDEIRQDVLSR